eukprot:345557_1
MGQHDGDLHTEDTLLHHHVTDGVVDVFSASLAGGDSVTIVVLHGLGTLATDLAGHGHFAALGTGLHDEAEDTVAALADGKATEELVLEGLGLGLGTKTTVGHTLSEHLKSTLGKVESLLDNGGQFSDSLALLAENVLGLGSLDDDLGADGGHTDLHTSVPILSQFASHELVQFSVKDTVSDELSFLGDIGGHVVVY